MTLLRSSKHALTVLKLYNFFSYGAFAVLYTFFPIYFSQQGLSKLEIGMIMAGGPLISVLANPFWGYISDRNQNIRKSIIFLLCGNLIVVQFVFHTSVFVLLYALMLIFFFFVSPLNSQGNSLILNAIEGSKHKFGSFRLWGSLGYAVTALSTGPVIIAIGMSKLWLVYTFMMITSLLFTFGMPKGEVAATTTGGFSSKGYGQVFRNKRFLLFLLLGVLIAVPNSSNSTFVSIYIQELGGSEVVIGSAAFISAFFEIFVFLALDRFIKRDTRYMLLALTVVSALFIVRWLLMSLAFLPIHILMIQLLHCVTFGAYYYLGTMLTAQLIPIEYRASGQAAFAITWGGISGIIAGVAGGWLYQAHGAISLYRVNVILALCGLIGFMIMLRLVGGSKKS